MWKKQSVRVPLLPMEILGVVGQVNLHNGLLLDYPTQVCNHVWTHSSAYRVSLYMFVYTTEYTSSQYNSTYDKGLCM